MAKTIIAGGARNGLAGLAAHAAAAAAITAAAEAQSLEKTAVDYRLEPRGGESCVRCAFYRAEPGDMRQGQCSMVIGRVAADAWCAIWSPAT